MPIISTVDHAKREIRAVAVGPVTRADVESHIRQQKEWQCLPYREMIDGRGAGVKLSPEEIRGVVDLLRRVSRETKLGPTAVIVSTDYAYGLMRMLEMLIEDVCKIVPFREEEEARAWLDQAARAANAC